MSPSDGKVRALEIRRERNRNSQRSSRLKQTNYIRELEERLKALEEPQDDRVSKLQNENAQLRAQLLAVHKKLESVQATLGSLSRITVQVLDVDNEDGSVHDRSPSDSNTDEVLCRRTEAPSLAQTTPLATVKAGRSAEDNSQAFENQQNVPKKDVLDFPAFSPSIELSSRAGQINFGINLPTNLDSQSALSNHLTTLKYFLQPQFTCQSSISTLATFMFSAFTACGWPELRTYFMYTRAHVNLSKILLWRALPTDGTYASLEARHLPTMLQLTAGYPLAIDIIPFPSIRDKLITHHTNDPFLDFMICEIAEAFVVEVDLSKLLCGLPSTPGFVGVWDLARAIEAKAHPRCNSREIHEFATDMAFSSTIDTATTAVPYQPVPTVDDLFGDGAAARQAFHFLGMDQGAIHWRLDPELFIKYPHLFDTNDDPRAYGIRLKPPGQNSIPVPRRMDFGSMSMYREFATINFANPATVGMV